MTWSSIQAEDRGISIAEYFEMEAPEIASDSLSVVSRIPTMTTSWPKFSLPIWTANEAFTDPEGLERLSNEGHGFSRAVDGLRV